MKFKIVERIIKSLTDSEFEMLFLQCLSGNFKNDKLSFPRKKFNSMSFGNNRQGIFIIGTLAGLLVGSMLAIYLYNNHVFNLKKSSNLIQQLNPFRGKTKAFDLDENKKERKTYTPSKVVIEDVTVNDTIYEIDSNDMELMDYHMLTESNTPVQRDEMLFSIDLIVEGQNNKGNQNLDSLLLDDKYSESQSDLYRVEFWKSPINFTGYKLQRQKLVLFGVFEYRSIKLTRVKNVLYLYYRDRHYRLEEGNEFSHLVPDKKM